MILKPVTVAQLYQLYYSRSPVYGKVEYANFARAERRLQVVRQPDLMALASTMLISMAQSQLFNISFIAHWTQAGRSNPHSEASAVELEAK